MADDIAIHVNQVSKDFVLPHEKVRSVKSAFTSAYKRRGKTKETQHALRGIEFEVKRGEFFGIVGRNGSGKSTLLKILAGIYQPTKGSIQTIGKLVPFIELGVGFNPELTGRENVYLNGAMLGFSRKEVDAMYDDIVAFAELEPFMDQKLKNYSSGMQVRLAFAMATRSEADILLVDEVLAVGDADFQRKCYEYFKELKRDKKTVVFVTHDMDAVREYCDRGILIEDSRILHSGTPAEIATRYSRLFIAENSAGAKTGNSQQKRWGDGSMTYSEFKVPKSLNAKDELVVSATVKAHADVDDPVFGLLVKNTAGQALLGTNSKIEQQSVGSVKKGQTLHVEWRVPNIFSDGKYFIDPAIVHSDGVTIIEWWEDAGSFTSYRETKTPYLVAPAFELSIRKGADR